MRFLPVPLWRCVAFFVVLLRGALFGADAPLWAHERSEIKPDARVVWGKLENGLRYAILPNDKPKNRVYVQLYVAAGSIQERDDERGLAHFVEHMAFKGTTHFRKNDLIEYTQKHGMSFGGDTNAVTSYDHTVYKLALAENTPAEVKAALLILRDWADGVAFDPAEFEPERGVIESERRLRDDGGSRVYRKRLERWLAGTAFADRSPIGNSEVILHAPLDKLRSFYDAWYRPERMVVVVVGDVQPAMIETAVREQFSDLVGRGQAREERTPKLPGVRGTSGVALGDAELSAGSTVSIESVANSDRRPDNVERRRDELRRGLAFEMFQRRLSEFAATQGYNFAHPSASLDTSLDPIQIAMLGAAGPSWRWNENIGFLEQQLRMAFEFGFTSAELSLVTNSRLMKLEQSVRGWRDLRSGALMDGLVSSIQGNRVFADPGDRQEITREFFRTVTPEDCLTAFRAVWKDGNRFVSLIGKGIEASKEPEILAAYEASQREAVRAPREMRALVFAYSDFGPPGKIEKQEFDSTLDFYRVTFANGIRLNVKRTSFRLGEVKISVRFAGGMQAQSGSSVGLARFVGAWSSGGLRKHPPGELRDINKAHVIGLSLSTDWENFEQQIATRPEDLRYALEFTTAHFLEPAYGKNEWRRVWSEQLDRRSDTLRSLDGIMGLRVLPLLAKGDERFEVPGLVGSFLTRRSAFIDWFEPILKTSPMEIAVVGDIDPLETIREVARTFGTLPTRRRERSALDGASVQPEERTGDRTFTYRSNSNRALNALAWRLTGGNEFPERQKIGVLGDILEDRIYKKVRAEMGSTYSPSVVFDIEDHSPEYAFLICAIETVPQRTGDVQAAVKEIARSLTDSGVTEEEFERARAPILSAHTSAVRTNDYWLDMLATAQSNPARFAWSQRRTEAMKALTKADLDVAAQNYLRPDRLSTFVIRPKD
jgi:zinc protease